MPTTEAPEKPKAQFTITKAEFALLCSQADVTIAAALEYTRENGADKCIDWLNERIRDIATEGGAPAETPSGDPITPDPENPTPPEIIEAVEKGVTSPPEEKRAPKPKKERPADSPMSEGSAQLMEALAYEMGKSLRTFVDKYIGEPQIEKALSSAMDARVETISKLIEDKAEETFNRVRQRVRPIQVVMPTGTKKDAGIQHRVFPEVLQLVTIGMNVYLVGPAGSGKTSLGHAVAKSMDIPFYTISVCAQSTKSDLLGYMNAMGSYVSTAFRQAYEHGGLFLLDEIDNGNANTVAVLNSATSNGFCAFPDKTIQAHEQFRCIAAANTFGAGADRMYVGRNQLDAATLDRFVFVEMGYDKEFETTIAGDTQWTQIVFLMREVLDSQHIRHLASPRSTIRGNILLDIGWKMPRIAEILLFKGMDEDTRKQVMSLMRTKNGTLTALIEAV